MRPLYRWAIWGTEQLSYFFQGLMMSETGFEPNYHDQGWLFLLYKQLSNKMKVK